MTTPTRIRVLRVAKMALVIGTRITAVAGAGPGSPTPGTE